ncbi:hypothetical protein IE994_16440 [Enterobacter hormaechei]|uniref:Uncharacterized protein n=1 Tax=Enterobacter hormaechei TaxID=158836 RepID=A0A927HKQ4_9ENTR|nr:hypothetical protein [Enterobacter hormaechei]MBD3717230.1 hypothetical protein [Enterobacter hormaechei]
MLKTAPACWVMSGNTYNDLLAEDAFVNGQNLFKFETINVIRGWPRAVALWLLTQRQLWMLPCLGGTSGTEKARQRVLGLMPRRGNCDHPPTPDV